MKPGATPHSLRGAGEEARFGWEKFLAGAVGVLSLLLFELIYHRGFEQGRIGNDYAYFLPR